MFGRNYIALETANKIRKFMKKQSGYTEGTDNKDFEVLQSPFYDVKPDLGEVGTTCLNALFKVSYDPELNRIEMELIVKTYSWNTGEDISTHDRIHPIYRKKYNQDFYAFISLN